MKPMLAHKYEERGKSVVYPAYVQPKLDGIRVIVHRRENDVIYTSRGENNFTTLEHLTPQIMEMFPPNTYLDGEAYVHGWSLGQISAAVKRDHPNGDTPSVRLWVFDFPSEKQFEMRNELLKMYALQTPKDSKLVFVFATRVLKEEHMKISHGIFTQEGFEGTMIRNAHAPYIEKKTVHLQKFKDFQDDEFEIVGTAQCTGKDKGLIKFICVTGDRSPKAGVEFEVEPMGDDASRREMWKNRDDFHGKWLTVKFQNYGEQGRPRFPNGVTIRDYE